jgi:hypothetical protein
MGLQMSDVLRRGVKVFSQLHLLAQIFLATMIQEQGVCSEY